MSYILRRSQNFPLLIWPLLHRTNLRWWFHHLRFVCPSHKTSTLNTCVFEIQFDLCDWIITNHIFIGFLSVCQTIQKMTKGGKCRLIKLAKLLQLQKEWYMKYSMSLKLFSLWLRYEYKPTSIWYLPILHICILKLYA